MNTIFLEFGKNAIIKYWDFNINIEDDLNNQLDNLKEDLVQVEFNNSNLLIDIGYYPSFSKDGKIILVLIEKNDWNKYLERFETSDIKELQKVIDNIIQKYYLN